MDKNIKVNYNGSEISLKELYLLAECNISRKQLYNRIIKHKMPIDIALQKEIVTPMSHVNKLLTIFGETKPVKEWTKDARCVVSHDSFVHRIFHKNIDPEKALIIKHLNKRILCNNLELKNERVIKIANKHLIVKNVSKLKEEIGIYAFLNIKNGKIYIGQSINLGDRINGHINKLNKNKHFNNHLQSSWNKYGGKNFYCLVLEKTESIDQLTEKEKYWIEHYKSSEDEYGFNYIKNPENPGRGQFRVVFDKEKLVFWIDQYKQEHGKYPNEYSGIITGTDKKLTWLQISCKLRYDSNSSLKKFIAEEFEKKEYVKKTLPKLISFHSKSKKFYVCVKVDSNIKFSIGFKTLDEAIKGQQIANNLISSGERYIPNIKNRINNIVMGKVS